jgi:hypothetical protein
MAERSVHLRSQKTRAAEFFDHLTKIERETLRRILEDIVKRRSLKTMPVDGTPPTTNRGAQLPAERGKASKWQPETLASESRRRSTRLAWRLLFANHKQASTLAAGCSGDIVSTTRSPRRLISVERPKPMSSAFRRQSRWASSPKSQQRPLLRGERSSMSNLFCKASESQPRRSLLLMNAWTSRKFALSLPHPPK